MRKWNTFLKYIIIFLTGNEHFEQSKPYKAQLLEEETEVQKSPTLIQQNKRSLWSHQNSLNKKRDRRLLWGFSLQMMNPKHTAMVNKQASELESDLVAWQNITI